MAKGRSKFDRLPVRLRYQLYERLLNGIPMAAIAEWLFDQDNENEDGQKCSEIWDRDSKSIDAAKWNCQKGLYDLLDSEEYAGWKRQHLKNSDLKRFNEGMEARLAAGGRKADDICMNVVMYYVEKITDGTADSLDVRRLVSAWSQLRGMAKNDALASALESKLKVVAAETKAARKMGDGKVDLAEILARIDEHLAGGKPRG